MKTAPRRPFHENRRRGVEGRKKARRRVGRFGSSLKSQERTERNLRLDAGFVVKSEVVEGHDFIPRVRKRGEEKREPERNPEFRVKRWIVEALRSWLKRLRKLCPRHEKSVESFRALLALAMGMIINKITDLYP